MPNSYTIPVTTLQGEALRKKLKAQGYEFVTKPYALYSAKTKGLSVTLYEKGPKLLLQGKKAKEFVEFTLEPEILGEVVISNPELRDPAQFEPHIGVDESGKGDYFGPLVIAGAYTEKESARKLVDLGVTDSKLITDKAIPKLADAIRKMDGVSYSEVLISPKKYNELYGKFKNLNRLLAWGHAKAVANILEERPNCPRSLSDQFSKNEQVLAYAFKSQGLSLKMEQRTKAESDVAVAAASVLARERFIKWMAKASEGAGISIPFGGSAKADKVAKIILSKHGKEKVEDLVKLHFVNSTRVFEA